ncbi:T9SS type A sorting domain-containing protein [Chryseobacterium sp. c4a]|uniref:T9SS type A sorting domain-containing protein n=1 Tax=Chryseobacterium sp. c4a TaxID=1573582 RepID=UPI00135C1BAA|nr:T9SS type A sorting domain-containing protein [Chryseobacterium sp. c4a]
MKKILSFIAVLYCTLLFSQLFPADWKLTTPFLQSEKVIKIEILPDGSYLVQKHNEDDDLLITENDGKTWRRINIRNKSVSDFAIHNNKGYAVMGYDLIISDPKFSTPGISHPLPVYFAQAMFVLNDNTIFISTINSRIMKSTDGGVTWNVYSVPTGYAAKITGLFFTDANTGYCVTEAAAGNSFIFKSTDGGQTWVKVSESPGRFWKVIFKNALNGIATLDDGTTQYTLDGGNTWMSTNIPFLKDIKVYNNEFIAVGTPNKLYRTATGEVWNSSVIYPTLFHVFNALALNGGKFLVGGDNETGDELHHSIFKSTDLVNWIPEKTNWIYRGGLTYNYAYASKNLATVGDYASTDKGMTWKYMPPSTPTGAISILPNGKGIGLRKYAYEFWTTQNNGLTWTSQSISRGLTGALAMKPNGDFAMATRGDNADYYKGYVTIYNATTGWSTPFEVGRYARIIKFMDNNVGFLVTSEKMMKTVDGGITWSVISFPGYLDNIRDIVFGDNSRIYIGDYCSVNLGNTWFTLNGWTGAFKDFEIFEDGSGYGVQDGNIFKTTDYGVNWQKIFSTKILPEVKWNIDKYAIYKDYIIGTGKSGFYTWDLANGTLTTDDPKIETNNKMKIYPNPTSSVLFFDSKEQIKNIVVVDMAGRVFKNIDSPKETSIDISDLAKGNYFVKITTHNKTYLEKVIKK